MDNVIKNSYIKYSKIANFLILPSIPNPDKPQDFQVVLNKIDTNKPIGIFLFNVEHNSKTQFFKGEWTSPAVNALRNNYTLEMRENYGDNMIIIDNPTPQHLVQFSKEFNKKFGATKPQVHFVANHHQNTYDDNKLNAFFDSIQARNKRALVLSCGPVSQAYKYSNLDYVVIPVPDGNALGFEPSIVVSPAYKKAISWMATVPLLRRLRAILMNVVFII